MPRISELPEADPLAGTEKKVVVQGGVTKQAPASNVEGTYVSFDANNNVNAARPTTPVGANFIWFNVPSEPTNLGTFDIWTSDAEVGGASTFVGLTDTPGTLGTAGQLVAVNGAGTALEFVAAATSGFAGGPSNIDGGDATGTGPSVIDGGAA